MKSTLAIILLLAVLDIQAQTATKWQCFVDSYDFYKPIIDCFVHNPGNVPNEINCIKTIDGAATYLTDCCSAFENSTSWLGQQFENKCRALGFNSANGPQTVECYADAFNFFQPIVECASSNSGHAASCVNSISGATTFMKQCCTAFQNDQNLLAQQFEKSCRYLGLSPPQVEEQ